MRIYTDVEVTAWPHNVHLLRVRRLGGVLAGTIIYGIPGDAEEVLRIDTATDEVTLIGTHLPNP